MNTLEHDTRLHRQRRPVRVESPLRAVASEPIAIVVLSQDEDLTAAIREAADDRHPVQIARTSDDAQRLAADGKAAILITDQALSQHSLRQIGQKMRDHDPAAITIAVGERGDDHALIGLLSSAVVERFMLKPVTASLARPVIRSAASEYRLSKSRPQTEAAEEAPVLDKPVTGAVVVPLPARAASTNASAMAETISRAREPATESRRITDRGAGEPMLQPQPAIPREQRPPALSIGLIALSAALVVGAVVWWSMQSRIPQIDPQALVAASLNSAQQALRAGRYIEPPESSALHYYSVVLSLDPDNAQARAGMDVVAQRMIDDVKVAIDEGRLAEAGIALERVRRISPDSRRLAAIDNELRAEQASLLQRLQAAQSAAQAAPVGAQPTPTAKPRNAATAAVDSRRAEAPAPSAAAPKEERVAAMLEPTASAAAPKIAETMGPPVPPSFSAGQSASTNLIPAAAAAIQVPEPSRVATAPREPKLVKVVEPEFPRQARARNVEGWVELELAVTSWGEVTEANVLEAKNGNYFERAALAAVKQWRYEPRQFEDPTATQPVRVRLAFQLAD